MEFRQEIIQRQSQQLVLSQNLRQSLEILGLSSQNLAERIQRELLENPILEEIQGAGKGSSEQAPYPQKSKANIDTLREKGGGGSSGPRQGTGTLSSLSQRLESAERKNQLIQNLAQPQESLGEHLLSQLRLSSLNEEEQIWGEKIISAIDKRGLLTSSLNELFPEEEEKQILKVLETIQGFDPLGCASRALAEALLFQARHHRPEDKVTERILRDHFTDLEELDFDKIEEKSGLSWEEIQKSLQFIQSLEPYPGNLYAQDLPEYILPDIIVQEREGELYLHLNDDLLPSLKISEDYEKLVEKANSRPKDKELQYLKAKLHSAQSLIQSIERRKKTLFQTAQKLVEHQKDFFLKGAQHLKPLILETIARKIEVHSSTVSRTISNKYLQCQWGYFELKYFFSAKLRSTSDTGDGIAAQNVKEYLKSLIDKEKSSSPLSDQKLVSILEKEGVRIARRTIAKYRKIMNIPSAERRQKIAAVKMKLGSSSL